MAEPIELCLADMERYENNIEYKSHEEGYTDSVEHKSKRISVDEGGVKFTHLPVIMGYKVAPTDVTGTYISQKVRD